MGMRAKSGSFLKKDSAGGWTTFVAEQFASKGWPRFLNLGAQHKRPHVRRELRDDNIIERHGTDAIRPPRLIPPHHKTRLCHCFEEAVRTTNRFQALLLRSSGTSRHSCLSSEAAAGKLSGATAAAVRPLSSIPHHRHPPRCRIHGRAATRLVGWCLG